MIIDNCKFIIEHGKRNGIMKSIVLKLTKNLKGDQILWLTIFFLIVLSVIFNYSALGNLAYRMKDGDALSLLQGHVKNLVVASVALIIVHRLNFKIYEKFSLIFLIFSFFLVLAAFKFGDNTNSVQRWIRVPIIGLSLQPSEFVKLSLILYVSKVLAAEMKGRQTLRNIKIFERNKFLHVLGITVLSCALVFPNDFSSSVLIFAIVFLMMFLGGIRFRYLGTIIVAGIIGIICIYQVGKHNPELWRFGTIKSRIDSFMGFNKAETKEDIRKNKDKNYQLTQAKIAIASGGLTGKKPGRSTQKYSLPSAEADFVFSIIIEEYGFLFGAIPVLLLYFFMLYRGGVIANKCSETFPALVVTGLFIGIAFQAIINMGVAVGMLPVTGQPLPLISKGGSSALVTCISLGIAFNISYFFQKEKEMAAKQ